ncbi:hypothetical protein ACF0H5_004707 [Mactra antiquata]
MYITKTVVVFTDPPFPTLPDKYQAVVEGTLADMDYTITVKEYFDLTGNRVALEYMKKGELYNIWFDYNNKQATYYHGSKCHVDNTLTDSILGNLNAGGSPHIINTAEALHLMNSTIRHYVNRTQIRGITVDQWQACLYWPPLHLNFTLDFYFTVQDWTGPITKHQIPVLAHVQGLQNGAKTIDHYYEYTDFRTTIVDFVVFETPAGIVCPGRPTKPLPPVPNFFHSKTELSTVGESKIYELEYWYDKDRNIIRTDQRLKYPFVGIQADTPVSIINDYNYGVKYVKNKLTGGCKMMKISDTDPQDFTREYNRTAQAANSLWYKVWLKDPGQFLKTDGNFTYTGQRSVRGLKCDLYSGTRQFGNNIAFFASYQYYVLAEGSSMYPDDGSSISKRVPVQLVITNEKDGIGVIETITQFSTDKPKMSAFDVSTCYPYNSSIVLNLRFQGSYKTGLHDELIESAHTALSSAMLVSPLRVQDVRLNYDNSIIYISAKLMDRSPAQLQFTFMKNYTSSSLNDKTFPSSLISSTHDCATVCVLNTDFICNSFDYCTTDSKNVCRLSQSRVGGGHTSSSTATQCQHFTRTVEAPSKPEINSSTAYTNLQLAIYSGRVKIQASLSYIPQPFVFSAFGSSVSYGLSYVIHKRTQQCTVSPISNSSFDVLTPTNENITGYVLRLKNPLEIFDLTQQFKYVGQSTIRTILCDVFEGQQTIDLGDGKQKAVVQFYFMAKNWEELSANSGQTVPSQPVSLKITAADSSDTIRYDISDFNEQHPDLTNFNLLPCYPGNKQRHFLIQFKQLYHPVLDTKLATFTKKVQMELSVLTGASPLRFQKPYVTYDGPNTYYLAIVVEQSPSLLDFTSISKLQGIYSMDASFPDVNSDLACAEICRNTSGFTCMSFDYCKTTKLCQLSKRHTIDGKLLRPNADCSHYSKTVDATSRPEPTVDAILNTLQNKIAEGSLVINLQMDNATVTKYPAAYLMRDVLRYDYGKETSETLSHFNRVKNQALHVLNDPSVRFVRYSPLSVDDCADKCRLHPTFDCESFSYCPDIGLCLLSDVHPAENARAFEPSQMCDLYPRKYSDSYSPTPSSIYIDTGSKKITGVTSVDICAKVCSNSTSFNCRSFDFCLGTSTCYLSDKHGLDIPKSKVAQTPSSSCTHYSKKYLLDYAVTYNRSYTGLTPSVFSNISLTGCSKLCSEYVSYACGSFIYCASTRTCNLYSSLTKYVHSNIIPSTTCDLYSRRFKNTDVQPPPPQQNQFTGKKYSGGTMAAVGFGMLVPGLLLGAALLYFIKTKPLIDRKYEREMSLINREQNDQNE